MSEPPATPRPGVGAALTAPFRGVAVLAGNPTLWPLVVIPSLMALGLLVGLYTAAWYGWDWVTAWIATPPADGEWGVWWKVAKALSGLGLVVAVPVLSALIAPAFAEPFLGALARGVRKAVTGVAPSPPSGLYASWMAPLGNLAIRLGLLVGLHLLLLPVLLVPVVGAVVYGALGWGVSAFVLGLTYLDYPLDTAPRLVPARERRAYFWKHWPAGFTLGLVVSLASLVICLTFLLLPVLVAGAVVLYLDLGGDAALPGGSGPDSAGRA